MFNILITDMLLSETTVFEGEGIRYVLRLLVRGGEYHGFVFEEVSQSLS